MPAIIKNLWLLLRETFDKWMEDNAPRLGAALAYYTIFSLAPLLIIAIATAGFVFGEKAAEGEIMAQLQSLLGQDSAKAIQAMIKNARFPIAGTIATVVGVVTLLVGATGIFGELQGTLNTIWKVQPQTSGGVLAFIKRRFLSFLMVLGTGFLLLVSLLLSAGLAAAGKFLGNLLPGPEIWLHALNFIVSFGIISALFAMMFKLLPDARIAWRDVWLGAAATAFLFTVGKFLVGLYLGKSNIGMAYGAAGSLVIILIWVYYSAQIFLYGAEFTYVYANRFGSLKAFNEVAEEKQSPLPKRRAAP